MQCKNGKNQCKHDWLKYPYPLEQVEADVVPEGESLPLRNIEFGVYLLCKKCGAIK